MIKKSYSIQMSYDVSDEEKNQAEKALICFNHSLKLLHLASEHLDIMGIPFKDHPDIATDQVLKFRAALRRFRDKSIENFNQFKIAAFQCITLMQMFSSDTQTLKIMKSFVSSIEDIENQVNDFSDLFGNLESNSFVTDVSTSIQNVQKECEQLEEIVEDRIKNHIQSNIIGKTWIDNVSDQLQMKVERKTPILIDLFKQRQDQLNDILRDKK
ncbi:MAG TPA: DUF4476 domain-containing protein [Cytophagaceae bacterium]|jgi:hypothetical protein|nr:DUF4476 domain-containing protein [Cytophagaceae bacterium]